MEKENDDKTLECPTVSNLLIGHSAWALQYLNPLYYQRCEQQLPRNPFYLDFESVRLKNYLEETMNQESAVHKRFSLELIYDVSDKESIDIDSIVRKSIHNQHRPRILEWGDALVLKIFGYLDLDAFSALAKTCRYMHAQTYAYIICRSSTALEQFTPWYYKGIFRFTHVKPFNRPLTYLELHTYFIHSVKRGHYGEIVSLIQRAKGLFKELIQQMNIQMANLRQKPIDIRGYFQFVIRKFVSTPYRNHDCNKRPIIYAIEEGNADVTQLLIENGAKIKSKYKGLQGKNALEMVIISRNLRMLKIILGAISKLPVKDGYDSFNKDKKIFELAVDYLNLEGLELLIKHYKLKAQNKLLIMQSITLGVCKAIIKKRQPVINLLMENTIEPNGLLCKDKSLLMVATKYGYFDIIDQLLGLPRTNVHIANSKGWSVLHYCARYGDQANLVKFIKFGANLDKFTLDGDSALSIAFKRGKDIPIIKELLTYTNNMLFQRMNTMGVMPLAQAKKYVKDEETLEQIIKLEDKYLEEAFLEKEGKKKKKKTAQVPDELMKLQRKLKLGAQKKSKKIPYQYEFKNLKTNLKRRNSLSTLYADPIKKEKKIQLGESNPKDSGGHTYFQQNMLEIYLYGPKNDTKLGIDIFKAKSLESQFSLLKWNIISKQKTSRRKKNLGAKRKKNYHRKYMFSMAEIKTEEIVWDIHRTLDNSEIVISYPYCQKYDAESERKAKIAKIKAARREHKRISEGGTKKPPSTWDLGKGFLNPPWKPESDKPKAKSIGQFEEKIQRMKNLEKRFILTPFKSNKERHNVRGILAMIRQSLNILNHIGKLIFADSPAAEAIIPFIQDRVDEVTDCDRIYRENPHLAESEEIKAKEEEEQELVLAFERKESLKSQFKVQRDKYQSVRTLEEKTPVKSPGQGSNTSRTGGVSGHRGSETDPKRGRPLTPKDKKPKKPTFSQSPSPNMRRFIPPARSVNPSPELSDHEHNIPTLEQLSPKKQQPPIHKKVDSSFQGEMSAKKMNFPVRAVTPEAKSTKTKYNTPGTKKGKVNYDSDADMSSPTIHITNSSPPPFIHNKSTSALNSLKLDSKLKLNKSITAAAQSPPKKKSNFLNKSVNVANTNKDRSRSTNPNPTHTKQRTSLNTLRAPQPIEGGKRRNSMCGGARPMSAMAGNTKNRRKSDTKTKYKILAGKAKVRSQTPERRNSAKSNSRNNLNKSRQSSLSSNRSSFSHLLAEELDSDGEVKSIKISQPETPDLVILPPSATVKPSRSENSKVITRELTKVEEVEFLREISGLLKKSQNEEEGLISIDKLVNFTEEGEPKKVDTIEELNSETKGEVELIYDQKPNTPPGNEEPNVIETQKPISDELIRSTEDKKKDVVEESKESPEIKEEGFLIEDEKELTKEEATKVKSDQKRSALFIQQRFKMKKKLGHIGKGRVEEGGEKEAIIGEKVEEDVKVTADTESLLNVNKEVEKEEEIREKGGDDEVRKEEEIRDSADPKNLDDPQFEREKEIAMDIVVDPIGMKEQTNIETSVHESDLENVSPIGDGELLTLDNNGNETEKAGELQESHESPESPELANAKLIQKAAMERKATQELSDPFGGGEKKIYHTHQSPEAIIQTLKKNDQVNLQDNLKFTTTTTMTDKNLVQLLKEGTNDDLGGGLGLDNGVHIKGKTLAGKEEPKSHSQERPKIEPISVSQEDNENVYAKYAQNVSPSYAQRISIAKKIKDGTSSTQNLMNQAGGLKFDPKDSITIKSVASKKGDYEQPKSIKQNEIMAQIASVHKRHKRKIIPGKKVEKSLEYLRKNLHVASMPHTNKLSPINKWEKEGEVIRNIEEGNYPPELRKEVFQYTIPQPVIKPKKWENKRYKVANRKLFADVDMALQSDRDGSRIKSTSSGSHSQLLFAPLSVGNTKSSSVTGLNYTPEQEAVNKFNKDAQNYQKWVGTLAARFGSLAKQSAVMHLEATGPTTPATIITSGRPSHSKSQSREKEKIESSNLVSHIRLGRLVGHPTGGKRGTSQLEENLNPNFGHSWQGSKVRVGGSRDTSNPHNLLNPNPQPIRANYQPLPQQQPLTLNVGQGQSKKKLAKEYYVKFQELNIMKDHGSTKMAKQIKELQLF